MQSWDNISEPFSGHAYEFLRFKGTPVSWVKVVWEPWCLPRHSFIPWLALLGRLRTRDKLHFIDTDASYVFCLNHEESHSHLFFACSWTSLLWSKVKSRLWLCRGMAWLVVMFGALILKGKMLLPEWKESPSALLSTWYGNKGIKESLRTPAHWLNLYFRDFRFYSTWYCPFMSAISLTLLLADCMVVVLDELSCGSCLLFGLQSLKCICFLLDIVVVVSLADLVCCMMLMWFCILAFFILQLAPMIATCLNFCFVLGWEPCNLWFLTQPLSVNFSLLALALM